jgi:hypothetical protein
MHLNRKAQFGTMEGALDLKTRTAPNAGLALRAFSREGPPDRPRKPSMVKSGENDA